MLIEKFIFEDYSVLHIRWQRVAIEYPEGSGKLKVLAERYNDLDTAKKAIEEVYSKLAKMNVKVQIVQPEYGGDVVIVSKHLSLPLGCGNTVYEFWKRHKDVKLEDLLEVSKLVALLYLHQAVVFPDRYNVALAYRYAKNIEELKANLRRMLKKQEERLIEFL